MRTSFSGPPIAGTYAEQSLRQSASAAARFSLKFDRLERWRSALK
jgi:hypothetical protein